MAETTERPAAGPGPMPTTDIEAREYRPLSGWAIASLLVAGLYVIVVVVGGGIALYTWSPYLLPLWTLVFPAAGLALAATALFHIRHSEGTRAGVPLARASLWTCLLLGLIYLSFYGSTFLAVRRQADTFVRNWFELLRAGKVNEAFLLTQPPEQRLNVSAEDERTLRARFDVGSQGGRGALTQFRANEIAQLIQQGGADSRIESRGVQSWEFTEGGYHVTRRYHVVTPEGEADLLIPVKGAESKARAYEGRQWYLTWGPNVVLGARLTERGQRMSEVRHEGKLFLDEWRRKLWAGTPELLESAYLDTQPVAEREEKRKAYQAGRIDLKGFVDKENLRADDPAAVRAVDEAIAGLFRPPADDRLSLINLDVATSGTRRWEQVQGRARFTYDGHLLFGIARKPKHRCELSVVAESEPGALEAGKSANWRVLRLELYTVQDPTRVNMMMGPPQ